MRFGRKELAGLLMLGMLVIGAPAHAQKAAASSCRPVDAETSEHLRYLRMLAAGTTQAAADWRAGTAIPFTTDTLAKVVVVSTSKTCSQALSAYVATAQLPSGSVSQVEVLRADTVFVVSSLAVPTGEFVTRYVYNSRFNFLRAYLK